MHMVRRITLVLRKLTTTAVAPSVDYYVFNINSLTAKRQ